ncbi:hypothetical protein [Mycolicibacterium llatzerense]|uniref:hypothetical protein n=1 Tax=Mycolicibacterium llatzerense TaxID=280871 RepID=UPI0021B652D2|nr:hypothetical protein [Mycolicibacterium llatzerense]MCT7371917.1 hypothetical protein [Mycolicibacterium llatzerense]
MNDRAERLIHYAAVLGWTEYQTAYSVQIPMTHTIADIAAVIDTAEHQRRVRADAGAIGDDREAYFTLCALPLDEPVRLADLDHHDRRILKRIPAGFVSIQADVVTRLARPAVGAVLAVIYDDQWERGLNRASHFAPFGTRVLALTSSEGNDLQIAAMESALHGIGLVAVEPGTRDQEWVAPEPWIETQPDGPVGWRFKDQAYNAWRDDQDSNCPNRSHDIGHAGN